MTTECRAVTGDPEKVESEQCSQGQEVARAVQMQRKFHMFEGKTSDVRV